MPRPAVRFTYDDYVTLPEGKRHEVLDGELLVVPAPSWKHQHIVSRLMVALRTFATARDLGHVVVAPLDVILTDEDVVQPDIVYVSKGREAIIAEEGLRGAPDLVVEVLSPATAARDRKAKARLYAVHGVREYWIVDPDAERVEVYLPGEGGFRLATMHEGRERVRSAVLPELELAAGEVFAG